MSSQPALDDPDDWFNRWLQRHPAELFAGNLARLVLYAIASNDDGLGVETLRWAERAEVYEAQVTYFLETFPNGRVFHVLSIVSPDDPFPDASQAPDSP